jgi:hypothetical protein
MTPRRQVVASLAVLGCLVASLATVGAARAPGQQAAALCIPILMPCPAPTTPADPGTPPPTSPIPDIPLPDVPGVTDPAIPLPTDPAAPVDPTVPVPAPGETPPAEAVPDDGAPVFTQPPAQLGASSLSFTGLRGIELVTVPLADGSRVTALKLSAESITIDGFALTVRHETGPSLATTADRMTLQGDVQVYVNSVTATLLNGDPLTLGADTPPPKDGIEPGLLRVTLGLVGATAHSITYTNTQQHLTE